MTYRFAPFFGAWLCALLLLAAATGTAAAQDAGNPDPGGPDTGVVGPLYQDPPPADPLQDPAQDPPATDPTIDPAALPPSEDPIAQMEAAQAAGAIYWGAYIQGSTYGLPNPPWDTRALDRFEANAKKRLGILHWGQAWQRCTGTSCVYQEFREQRPQYEAMRQRGVLAFVDWASWVTTVSPVYTQPKFSLGRIIAGDHDAYIRRWASEAKAWGYPILLRFNWEMNGAWFPWSETRNGNSRGQFVQAWRHVHGIFRSVGATNVKWVWCANVVDGMNTVPLSNWYPGDAYVDVLCMDGYNWGTNPAKNGTWKSFSQVFAMTYGELTKLSSLPIIIGETASSEYGGSKAAWITDALKVALPQKFPRVIGVLWFNWNNAKMDWVIETSSSAQSAFASAIASSYYLAGPYSITASGADLWPPAPAPGRTCTGGGCLYLPAISKP